MEGTPFGRFRLIGLLGRSGFSDVWRADDTAAGRPVALKVLPVHSAGDPFVARLFREARVAAALAHPHVVAALDTGEVDGRPFLATPLIEGRDLEALLTDGPLSADRSVTIVEQVGSALDAAHRGGLVHRGVKPSEILVGTDDSAYLTDFGAARGTSLSEADRVETWAYLAPEQISAGEADARADVYGLTCVLYHCLTGSQPFPGGGAEQQIAAHLSQPPPRPSSSRSDLPPTLDDVIATGMAKDPAARYPSAGALAAAARAAIGASPATPPPLAERPLGTGPIDMPPVSHSPAAVDPPAQEPRRPRRRRRVVYAGVAALVAVVAAGIGIVLATGGDSATKPPPAGTFDGVYRAEFGQTTTLDGKTPTDTYFAPLTAALAVRSACGGSGCVAIARPVDGPVTDSAAAEAPAVIDRFVLDSIDDTWVSVTVAADRNGGRDQWRVLSLRERPDGTFAGTYRYSRDGRAAERTVTLTRTGDVGAGQEPDSPADLPPRASTPALALRGTYSLTRTAVNVTVGELDEPVDATGDLTAFTNCLRTGERCFSSLTNDDSKVFLEFADGVWAFDHEGTVSCGRGGGTAHRVSTFALPMPQPAPDPVPFLQGAGHIEDTGECALSADIDARLDRTGG